MEAKSSSNMSVISVHRSAVHRGQDRHVVGKSAAEDGTYLWRALPTSHWPHAVDHVPPAPADPVRLYHRPVTSIRFGCHVSIVQDHRRALRNDLRSSSAAESSCIFSYCNKELSKGSWALSHCAEAVLPEHTSSSSCTTRAGGQRPTSPSRDAVSQTSTYRRDINL